MSQKDTTTKSTGFERARGGAGRPVVVPHFVSLDGFVVGPEEDMSWVVDHFNPEMADDIAVAMTDQSDTFVLGRVTYQIFESYWPTAKPYEPGDALAPAEGKEDPRIIRALNDYPKIVFSKTLKPPAWKNTRVVREGVEEEIRRLKQQPGRAINVQGSASIVQTLARADLIDEYQLYVHPVVLGDGKPLFRPGFSRQDFERVRVKPYENGVMGLTYRRK